MKGREKKGNKDRISLAQTNRTNKEKYKEKEMAESLCLPLLHLIWAWDFNVKSKCPEFSCLCSPCRYKAFNTKNAECGLSYTENFCVKNDDQLLEYIFI